MLRPGETRWSWKIGRGRRMAQRRRRFAAAPSTALEDRLDDASRVTSRYDAVTDWTDGRGTITEKLMVSSWTLRFWRAGPQFRGRMLRSTILTVAVAVGAVVLAALIS